MLFYLLHLSDIVFAFIVKFLTKTGRVRGKEKKKGLWNHF